MFSLAKLMVTPPGGAGPDRLTAKLLDWPGATVSVPLCRLIRLVVTVTVVTALWKPGALAVRFAAPEFPPVRVKVAVVAPCAMVKVDGETLTMFVSLLPRVTTTPEAGAGPSSVTVALKLRPAPSSGPGVISVIARRATL